MGRCDEQIKSEANRLRNEGRWAEAERLVVEAPPVCAGSHRRVLADLTVICPECHEPVRVLVLPDGLWRFTEHAEPSRSGSEEASGG